MKIIPNELDRFVSTTEKACEQNRNSRSQCLNVLKDTLKKLEAIAERGKGA
jgi:hypothetical protein